MILKDSLSFNQVEEEDVLPLDKVDNILALRTCVDPAAANSKEEGNSTEADTPVTPSRQEQRPRKRVRPARYHDDSPA